jgi:hypothetical protein
LLCKRTTCWHYGDSIISDFTCIPFFHSEYGSTSTAPYSIFSHFHGTSMLKYSLIKDRSEFRLVLPSEYCGYFPQLYFLLLVNLHLDFKIFRIRHFLTRIPLPSRPITSSKSLILQHAFAYQSQTSCMDLVNQWKSNKIQEDSALCL